jgi:signal transduction histidine kinase
VCKLAMPELDKAVFQGRLNELLLGRLARFEATYSLNTPHGRELKQVQIAPLQDGDTTRFAAIHEDLTERARILATLDETSDQLLHAQEQERRRIAVELHDSTSQHLAGLVLGLHNLRRRVSKNRGAQGLIDEMAELAQQAVRETRVLSYLMNADGVSEGLEVSAQRFVDGFARRTGLVATFESDGPVNAVSAAAQHAVFRVIQEALSNVYRHARASKVAIKLVNQASVLMARISDNGKGFERTVGGGEAALLGVGIPGMRARIEQLGGVLQISSNRGGTIVTATVPVGQPGLRL